LYSHARVCLCPLARPTSHSPGDYRIFCGDLAPEVKDEDLRKAFSHYASLVKSRVVRDPKSKKSKGYGFVSFKEGKDFIKALKEMDGKL
jgi:RNA recognition motif-containing protein